MSFFDDDPFEDIVREFFRGSQEGQNSNGSSFISGEDEERKIDYSETSERIFLIFELPGYEDQDVKVEIKSGKIFVFASKKPLESTKPYLVQKLSQGLKIVKDVPESVKNKKHNFTFSNGILEVSFKK